MPKKEGEGEEGFESERKFILGGTAGRSRLLTAALGVRLLGVGWDPEVSCSCDSGTGGLFFKECSG